MKVTGENFDDLLLDYLYGELDAGMRAAFEAYVAEHPDARAAVAEMRATRAALSPLAADLEPSQMTTNRVLAHARDAAERMERGRGWGLLPRYAGALAAAAALAVGVVVLRPAAQRGGRFEVAKQPEAVQAPYEASAETLAKDVPDAEVADRFLPSEGTAAPALGIVGEAGTLDADDARAFARDVPAAEEREADAGLDNLDAPSGRIASSGSRTKRRLASAAGPQAPPPARVTGGFADGLARQNGNVTALEESAAAEPPFALNRLMYQAPTVEADETAGAGAFAIAKLEAERPAAKARAAGAGVEAKSVPQSSTEMRARDNGSPVGDERMARPLAPALRTSVAQARADKPDARWREGATVYAPALSERIEEGRKQQVTGAYWAAIQNFQFVVLNAPAAPIAAEAQFETARSLIEVGDCPRAIEALQDVLDNAPAFPRRDEALLAQAACFNRLGDYEAEVERYAMFEAEHPGRAGEVFAQRVLAERNLEGRTKKARGAGDLPASAAK